MNSLAYALQKMPTLIAVALVAVIAGCSNPPVALDVMPTTTEIARQLAQTVASNGGCGTFEDYNFNRAKDTWVFTCQKPGLTFEIQTYGSLDARSTELKALGDRSATYFSDNFYAVVVVYNEALTPLAPFRGKK
jgi:hypothetical protein